MQFLRQAPQVGEALVVAADAAFEVGDEDAVGGRFEGGAQFGDQFFQLAFDAALVALVADADEEDRWRHRSGRRG